MSSDLRFQDIYETYRTRIVRYLTRLVGEAEAEDLTQEVFVKVSHGLQGFRGESQLLTWIYRIATNTALDRLRSPSLLTIEAEQEVEAGSLLTGQRSLTVEQQAIRNEMSSCVRQVIDRLPETYRTAIVLGDIEGFKDGEVAEILGLSLPAAKITLHRARTRLRKALSDCCVFYRNEDNELVCDRKIGVEKAETSGD